jgi:hypothetical protein
MKLTTKKKSYPLLLTLEAIYTAAPSLRSLPGFSLPLEEGHSLSSTYFHYYHLLFTVLPTCSLINSSSILPHHSLYFPSSPSSW